MSLSHDPSIASEHAVKRPGFLDLLLPFWKSPESIKAYVYVAITLIIMFGGVSLAVWSNKLDGQVVDAMVGRQWGGLWPVMTLALVVSIGTVMTGILQASVSSLLDRRWRTWMTERFLKAWTRNDAYYDIEREGVVDNADQRIAQDIERFVQLSLTLSLGVIGVTVRVISFTLVLWSLSGTLEFTVGRWNVAIPGYMVYLAYLYAFSVLLITHLTGRQLTGLFMMRQKVEADFRYLGMQLRENAEQIAFYRGAERERQRLSARFEDVRRNWLDIIIRTAKMMFSRDVYVQAMTIVPTLAALPRYLGGAISLGDVTRVVGAFNTLNGSLSYFYQAYVGYAEWRGCGNRLRDLQWAIDRAAVQSQGVVVSHHDEAVIALGATTLNKPSGETISCIEPLRIGAGERWLIRGRSGAGKSTLLRAIAGLWPFGSGEVRLPRDARLMFLPQRSYIPFGTLKAALCYPGNPQDFSDAACLAALDACLLTGQGDQLHVEDRWQQKLSGGEQQRLAVARAILHQPDFLFLDEATSALDGDTEAGLYDAILNHLPNAAIVSVAHREALEGLHDRVLEMKSGDPMAA